MFDNHKECMGNNIFIGNYDSLMMFGTLFKKVSSAIPLATPRNGITLSIPNSNQYLITLQQIISIPLFLKEKDLSVRQLFQQIFLLIKLQLDMTKEFTQDFLINKSA